LFSIEVFTIMQITRAVGTITLSLLIVTLALPSSVLAQQVLVPGEKSLLYYKMGGGEPVSRAANPLHTSLKIGLGGIGRLNYSCGRFDAGVTIQNLMNQYANAGTVITGAVRAGIAALPMYILQRASPGLYELFQTYYKKAEAMYEVSLKSCEEMEAQIRQGGDPYEDWIKLAKGEDWKNVSMSTVDSVSAKTQVETNAGTKGVTWLGGVKKGGEFQDPIQVVRDLIVAGYNTTMSQPVLASPTAVFPSTGPAATKLTTTFPTPTLAANWLVKVIGDSQISLCDRPGCQAKAKTPGTGLLQQFDAERPIATTQLTTVVTGVGVPNGADLEAASAPGVAITRELVDALRAMRSTEASIAIGRISMEVAQARTIDRALLLRNVLQTGASLPEAGYIPAQEDVHEKVAQLNRYIDDLLFETRVRREIVSSSANATIEAYRAEQLKSSATQTQNSTDKRPLEGGRVQ
jgi:integrating conjugative element protein (TIGR03755 family)